MKYWITFTLIILCVTTSPHKKCWHTPVLSFRYNYLTQLHLFIYLWITVVIYFVYRVKHELSSVSLHITWCWNDNERSFIPWSLAWMNCVRFVCCVVSYTLITDLFSLRCPSGQGARGATEVQKEIRRREQCLFRPHGPTSCQETLWAFAHTVHIRHMHKAEHSHSEQTIFLHFVISTPIFPSGHQGQSTNATLFLLARAKDYCICNIQ